MKTQNLKKFVDKKGKKPMPKRGDKGFLELDTIFFSKYIIFTNWALWAELV